MSDNITHKTVIKIPFFDVDSLQIAWHGHYVKYLEIARCELLDKIGYNYNDMADSGFMWPIVDLQIKYIKPVKFGQLIEIESKIIEYENRLKIAYSIYDQKTGNKLTKALTTQLALDLQTHELQFVSPEILIDKIRRFT
ncbi:acyl-CoA thioesterase [Facilibium subflavum]|uniref:acyl-CoA thioesterase n=1 Tax=Facilibium subflavum TaxID=2219058 RepID=UPI000E65A2BA|nr:thioesterase family protein [Facilibium subflavum]